MFLVKARNFKQYKENLILFSVFSLIYFVRTKKYLFPQNYQQDDISELRVSFYEDFICALNMGGPPIIDIKNMDYFKNIKEPEYVISIFIIFVTIVSFVLIFKIFKDHFNLEIAIFVFTILLFHHQLLITQYH